jgi:hypothetical protein
VALGATAAYAEKAAVKPSSEMAIQAQGPGGASEVEGLSLMTKGDNWAGTNVLKAKLAKNDTPLNRFNLATGYQRTGRIDQAQALYEGLLKKGQTTTAMATPASAAEPPRLFNLAQESASRLLYLSWLKSSQTPANPASAGTFAVDTSAKAGGPTDGDVTDAQALVLDRMAHEAAHP